MAPVLHIIIGIKVLLYSGLARIILFIQINCVLKQCLMNLIIQLIQGNILNFMLNNNVFCRSFDKLKLI